ncbi:uncharacterized protein HaLaN_09367, partial [Haematococcus lacustris]
MAENLASSLRQAIRAPAEEVVLRVPRWVDPTGPLAAYSHQASLCRLLHQGAAGGAFAGERFITGLALTHGAYGIVTAAHLLCLAPLQPNSWHQIEVVLALPLDCLLFASSTGTDLQ